MPRTILQTRHDGVAFYLNTETSSQGAGNRNRYRLFRTSGHGRNKDGWVRVGSQDGQLLLAITDERELFHACQQLFDLKRPNTYRPRETIRGRVGAWEGEAFRARPKKADTTASSNNRNLTQQASR